ncbi:kynurenine formamidase-like [Biomphalaria glabrata]|uniref:Kynurenine formamidase-like n=1 Tax=Biomphalaria glabrata TaxID=6526 RepID=A0A9U8DY19_BIOGL|nr:kynurenine formamidase-like [Biomphalaria glabrata]
MEAGILFTFILLTTSVQSRIIDLSHDHGPNTVMANRQPHYNWTQIFQGDILPGVYAETGAYYTAEHGGTHIDAPAHFTRGGLRLEKVTVEMTIAEGVMIDCSFEASRNRSYLVPLQKILDWEAVNGCIPDNAAVIFNFGWSQYFHSVELYEGSANDIVQEMSFPAIGKEAGLFLLEQRNIKIIGTDTATPDPFNTGEMPIHQNYLPKNRLIVEDLKDTGLLPAKGFRFHASPVKYVGATGAQVRAYAMTYDLPESDETGFAGAPRQGSHWINIVLCLQMIVVALYRTAM